MAHELQKLSHVHMAMVEQCVAGVSVEELSKMTGRSPEGIRLIINSPLFQDQLARRRDTTEKRIDEATGTSLANARKILEDSAESAARIQVDLLNYPDPKVRQTAVSEIFDRTFGKGSGTSDARQVTVNLGPQAILNLQIALEEDQKSRIVESKIVQPLATEAA